MRWYVVHPITPGYGQLGHTYVCPESAIVFMRRSTRGPNLFDLKLVGEDIQVVDIHTTLYDDPIYYLINKEAGEK